MKSTKRSLVLSTLSLVVCIAMLLGTTFAWFTDSVTSGKNKIVAGNLDIELEYFDGTSWAPVTESVKLFDDAALWEPGYTEVAYLRLSNKGNLDLKYNLAINIANEVAGINKSDESFKLSDYIKMGVDESWAGTAEYADRATARAAVTEAGNITTYTKSGSILASETDPMNFAIVVFMPEEVGNAANHKTGTTAPSIELGVSITATQLASEEDSFDNLYDAETPWLGDVAASLPEAEDDVITISTPEEFAKLSAVAKASPAELSGKTVKLGKNIDLNNIAFTPISSGSTNWTFDGNGKTVKNLKLVSSVRGNGLFTWCVGLTVKNLTVDGATVTGTGMDGVIAGNGTCISIDKCTVKNATVTSDSTVKDSNGDYNGDKSGIIVGYLCADGGNATASVTNCKVENCIVKGYRDLGGIAGMLNKSATATVTATGNSVKNVTVISDAVNNYKGYAEEAKFDANEIFGETVAGATVSDNTKTDSKVIFAANVADAVKKQVTSAAAGETVNLISSANPVKLTNVTLNDNVTVKGDGKTVIEDMVGLTAKNVTFENVVIKAKDSDKNIAVKGNCSGEFKDCVIEGDRAVRQCYALGDVVFDNCTIKGDVYGIHFDDVSGGATANIIVKNCDITGWNSIGEKISSVTFENCTFHKGTYGCIRFYQNGTVKNCTFDADFEWIDVASNNITVTMTGNTGIANTKLYKAKAAVTGSKFVVDGTDVTELAVNP